MSEETPVGFKFYVRRRSQFRKSCLSNEAEVTSSVRDLEGIFAGSEFSTGMEAHPEEQDQREQREPSPKPKEKMPDQGNRDPEEEADR